MPAGLQRFRMKPNCVVDGVPGWTEGGVYQGREGTGAVRTVELWLTGRADPLEVLRGSVVEVTESGVGWSM